MKKLHSLIILLILAAAVFVGCSPSTGNGVEAVETESKVNEYGFISSETYTVVFTNGSSTTMTGEALTNAAKDTGMVNGTDYTINGKTVTLTVSGMAKMTSYLENGGNSSGGDNTPMTYTLVGEPDSAKYVLANLSTTETRYAEGDTVTFSIKNTITDKTPTETELYLVKVTITERYDATKILNIPVTVTKDHKITFTMPDKDVMVRADFEDVSFKNEYNKNNPGRLTVATYKEDLKFDVGICFTEKVFDNLEYIDSKYVFRVADKGKTTKTERTDGGGKSYRYKCIIETTYTEHKLCAIVKNAKVVLSQDNSYQINL